MSTHVSSQVGSCCGGFDVTRQLLNRPFMVQDEYASCVNPRIRPYSGWASYKNVKSGDYSRFLDWRCAPFLGFPQTAGLYDLQIDDVPAPEIPSEAYKRNADEFYKLYQQRRMSNHPGIVGSEYSNYLNSQCGYLYPKQYVKGNWPDEYLHYTNTPANSCTTRPSPTPGSPAYKPHCPGCK